MTPGHSLGQRVVHAGFWTYALRSLTRAIGTVRNIVLARLLAPDDVGLFGMALVVLSIVDRFSNTGLKSAIIQKKGDVSDYLDNAWTVQVLRGIGGAFLIYLIAPYAAVFFHEPRAAPLIRLLAFGLCLPAFQNPGIFHYMRDLEFQRQFLYRAGGLCTELGVSIWLAFTLRNAWAPMIGLVSGRAAALVLSYVVHPYRPRIRFHWQQTRELGHYGRWIFLNNVLFFLAYRGDNLMVGKLLGSAALGIYALAYTISEATTVEISRMVTDTAFPAYARIQHDADRLRRAFSTAVDVVASIAFPAAALLALLAEPITVTVLGERWRAVAALLPPLAIVGAVRVLLTNGGAAYRGVGRPKLAFQQDAIGVIVTYSVMLPLVRIFGLRGVAFAVLTGTLAIIPLFVLQTNRVFGLGARDLGRMLLPALVLSAGVALPALAARMLIGAIRWPHLAVVAALCAAAFGLVALFLHRTMSVGPVRVLGMIRANNIRSHKRADSRGEPDLADMPVPIV